MRWTYCYFPWGLISVNMEIFVHKPYFRGKQMLEHTGAESKSIASSESTYPTIEGSPICCQT